MPGGLVGRFVFRNCLVVGLLLVVIEHALHAFLVPTRWVLCVCHGFFRRRRRTIRTINGVFARVVDGMTLMWRRPPTSRARITPCARRGSSRRRMHLSN